MVTNMNRLKKIISTMLVTATFFTSVAIMPLASAKDYTTEINFITALGVEGFSEESQSFSIKRSEFAKALAQALGQKAEEITATQYFTDVTAEHDAYAYISYLVDEDILHGYDSQTFMPDKEISYDEAVKLCLNALGYETYAGIIGGYSDGYLNLADKIGLDIDVEDTNSLNFGEASELIYKMLNSYYVEVGKLSADGIGFNESSDTLMEKVFDIEYGKGQVTAIKNGYVYGMSVYETDDILIDYVPYKTTQTDLFDLLGVEVDYYSIDGDIVYMEQNEDVQVYDIAFDEIKPSSTINEISAKLDGKTEEFEIDGNASFVYNGEPIQNPTDSDIKPDYGELRLIDNNDDEVIDVVIIWDYKNYIIKSASSDRITFRDNGTMNFVALDDESKTFNIMFGSEFMDTNLLDSGYVVTYAESKDASLITMFVYSSETEGTLEGFDQSGLSATIEGEEYTVAPGVDLSKLMGVYTTFYIDKNNRIADYLRFDESQVGMLLSMVYDESEEILYTKIMTEAGITRYTNNLDQKVKVGVGDTTNATKKTVDVLYNDLLDISTGKVKKQIVKYTLTSTGDSLASLITAENAIDVIPSTDEENDRLRLSFDHQVPEQTDANKSELYRQKLTLKPANTAHKYFQVAYWTTVMCISEDEEKCSVMPLTTFQGMNGTVPLYNFQLYNLNREGWYEYIVVEMDIDATATMFTNEGNEAIIVTEVSEKWDETKEAVDYSITGIYTNDSARTPATVTLKKASEEPLFNAPIYTIEETGRQSRYTPDNETFGSYEWSDIREGDIILYKVNELSGRVECWGYLARREDLTSDYCNNDFAVNIANMIVNGTVIAKSDEAIRLKTSDKDISDPEYVGIDKTTSFARNEFTAVTGYTGKNGYLRNGTIVYDSETHEAKAGSWEDFSIGDRLFLYRTGGVYHTYNFYIVIK